MDQVHRERMPDHLEISASAENLSNDTQSNNDGSSMCLELALEGERLCKSGDCRAGVAFFQAAIQAGTDDLRTLSAIYSQLGNAYFYLGDYSKAMQYHKLDLTLARSMDDKLGEAKSSGNLGNTLKVMGRFDEAAICCDRHLALAKQLGDRMSEGRALYNLGNVYHAKGKHMGQKDPGDFSEEVKESLVKAVEFYHQNLALMRELADRGAQGRACGNLGNTYYLLGDFQAAIEYHQERLRIAREFGDKAAERRANSNLGNSHIFLGQFEAAAENYKRTLSLAIELGERAVEAQACYSLGNTYTLLREFPVAIDYHQRHFNIAQELGDKVGEARACWSLGNAYSAIGNHDKSLHYAQCHYSLATELSDPVGQSTAKVNIMDLRKVLGMPEMSSFEFESFTENSQTEQQQQQQQKATDDNSRGSPTPGETSSSSYESAGQRQFRVRRQSMEQLDLIKLTPDAKKAQERSKAALQKEAMGKKINEDDFFDLLSRTQSKRMDDQRCSLKVMTGGGGASAGPVSMSNVERKPLQQQPVMNNQQNILLPKETTTSGQHPNQLLEMIADLQGERMDGQRAALAAPGLNNSTGGAAGGGGANAPQPKRDRKGEPDDAFLDMLMRCQGSRLEEQRSELPKPNAMLDVESAGPGPERKSSVIGATVPDEDFFSLISRVQGGRMEDQRAAIPLRRYQNGSNGGASSNGGGSSADSSTKNGTAK